MIESDKQWCSELAAKTQVPPEEIEEMLTILKGDRLTTENMVNRSREIDVSPLTVLESILYPHG